MKIIPSFSSSLGFLFVALPAWGAASPVSLQYPENVQVKDSKTIAIDVNVGKGFHIQANPVSHEGLIATELQLDASSSFDFSSFVYPKGVPMHLSQADYEVMTYSGNFQISFTIVRRPSTLPAPHQRSLIKGRLRFQACNDRSCFRPSAIPFELWVEKK